MANTKIFPFQFPFELLVYHLLLGCEGKNVKQHHDVILVSGLFHLQPTNLKRYFHVAGLASNRQEVVLHIG